MQWDNHPKYHKRDKLKGTVHPFKLGENEIKTALPWYKNQKMNMTLKMKRISVQANLWLHKLES